MTCAKIIFPYSEKGQWWMQNFDWVSTLIFLLYRAPFHLGEGVTLLGTTEQIYPLYVCKQTSAILYFFVYIQSFMQRPEKREKKMTKYLSVPPVVDFLKKYDSLT